MRYLALAPFLIAAPIAANDAQPAKPICQNIVMKQAQGDQRAGVHPLNQEPPVQEIKAVLRTVDGCSKPVLVSEQLHGQTRTPERH